MGGVNLQMLVEDSNSESGLIFNSEGVLIDSHNLEKPTNLAAMAGVITSMSNEFFQDSLNVQFYNQLTLNSNDGLIIINRVDENLYVALFTKDTTKVGLIGLILKNIKQK